MPRVPRQGGSIVHMFQNKFAAGHRVLLRYVRDERLPHVRENPTVLAPHSSPGFGRDLCRSGFFGPNGDLPINYLVHGGNHEVLSGSWLKVKHWR